MYAAAADREGGGHETLARLLAQIALPAGTSVGFREEKTFSFLESPLVSYGRLRFEAPDRLIRETAGPRGTRYVVSASSLVVEEAGKDPREIRLEDFPALQGLMDTMRALFTGNLPVLSRSYQVGFESDGRGWILKLIPRAEDILRFVSEIRVTGRRGRIRTIETIETGGDRVLMTIIQDG